MPLIHVLPNVLQHTDTGLQVVFDTKTPKVSIAVAGADPIVYRMPEYDPIAVWNAIREQASPPRSAVGGIATAPDEMPEWARNPDVPERQAADAGDLEALAARVDGLCQRLSYGDDCAIRSLRSGLEDAWNRLDVAEKHGASQVEDLLKRINANTGRVHDLTERVRHIENWRANRNRGLADPQVLAMRLDALERWAREEIGRWPSGEPDGPRDRRDIAGPGEGVRRFQPGDLVRFEPILMDRGMGRVVEHADSGIVTIDAGGRRVQYCSSEVELIPPPDPDAPRRFRCKSRKLGIYHYGVYWPRLDRYTFDTPGAPGATPGKPAFNDLEWLDPEPFASAPEPDGSKDRHDPVGTARGEDRGGATDADGHHVGLVS